MTMTYTPAELGIENVRVKVPVNWEPRVYQRRAWNALTSDAVKRIALVWHRRAGKDLLLLNATVLAALKRVGVYWHVFPTAKQGRKILWDGVTKNGRPFIDHWPAELIATRNETDMRIKLTNGSIWQVVGSDNYNEALVGGNPAGLVFSEYALQNPRCWDFLRPILVENDGWAAFAFTPRGNNHGAKLFDMARANPAWFAEKLTVDDTHAIRAEAIAEERAAGMPDELIEQEFYCSFAAAVVGSYYGKALAQLEREGHMTDVSSVSNHPVEVWWDLGMNDATALWFVQRVDGEIWLIDYYEASNEGLDHYAQVLRDKSYDYERHVFPHDIAVRELGTGRSRLETLKTLGVINHRTRAVVAPRLTLADGINAVRTVLPRCYFDAAKCERGIEALKQYQRKWDDVRKTFEDYPSHDWTSHAADAFRYGALTVKDRGRANATLHFEQAPGGYLDRARGTFLSPDWGGGVDTPRTEEVHDDPNDHW